MPVGTPHLITYYYKLTHICLSIGCGVTVHHRLRTKGAPEVAELVGCAADVVLHVLSRLRVELCIIEKGVQTLRSGIHMSLDNTLDFQSS